MPVCLIDGGSEGDDGCNTVLNLQSYRLESSTYGLSWGEIWTIARIGLVLPQQSLRRGNGKATRFRPKP